MQNKKNFYHRPYRINSRFTIQIGNFRTKEEAQELMKKMADAGFTGYLVEKKYRIQEIGTHTTTRE